MPRPKKTDTPTEAAPKNPKGRGKGIVSVSRKSGYKELRELPCFPEVHKRIIDEGRSLQSTAEWLQEEKKHFLDHSATQVATMLLNYRQSLPTTERAKPLKPYVEKALEELQEGIDELQELTKLYRVQEQRISIDFTTEKNIKKLLPTMSQEIRTAREILSASAQLKMDLGVNERHLGTVDVETSVTEQVAEKYADTPAVAAVLENGDSRRKVLGLAERLLAIAGRVERHPEVADELEQLSGTSHASD